MTTIYHRNPETGATELVATDNPFPVDVITQPVPAEYVPIDHETVTVAATAVGLTAGKYEKADRALITLETAQVRFRYDGAAVPTSTAGHVLDVGVPATLDGLTTMAQFRAIRTGATSGTLTVTYEKRR